MVVVGVGVVVVVVGGGGDGGVRFGWYWRRNRW